MNIIQDMGLAASIIMPLFNIPLIIRIIQRRSSEDISMSWALGVWVCCLVMAPSGFTSKDLVWRCFNVVNLALFTAVVFTVIKYRKPRGKKT